MADTQIKNPYIYRNEKILKKKLIDQLIAEGHKQYALQLNPYYLNVTWACPTARVYSNKPLIEINPTLADTGDMELLSVLIRHELLHKIFEHNSREIRYISKKLGFDPNHLSHENMKAIRQDILDHLIDWGGQPVTLSNFAGDWDLSRKYTSKDKAIIIEKISGLILETDHPEWMNLSFEEILAKLEEQVANNKKEAQKEKEKQEKKEKIELEWKYDPREENPEEELPPDFEFPEAPTQRPETPPPIKMPPLPPGMKIPPIEIPNIEYHYGKFVDNNTFVDDQGNAY